MNGATWEGTDYSVVPAEITYANNTWTAFDIGLPNLIPAHFNPTPYVSGPVGFSVDCSVDSGAFEGTSTKKIVFELVIDTVTFD